MTIAILSLLAAALDLFAVGISWRRARRIARLTSGRTRAFATALKRVPDASRLAELLRLAPPGSFEHDLATELLAARDDAARIAAVNDALLDAEHGLRQGAASPRAGIRIALAGGLLLGLLAWLTRGDVRAAVILVAAGGAAALLCFEAGRNAARRAAALRADIDALIGVALRDLADAAPPAPARAEARRGSPGGRPSRRRRST